MASSLHFIFIMITHGKLFPSSGTPVLDDDVAAEKVNSGDESVTIIPRESRKYDIVLLGATGFTGKLGAAYLAKQYGGEYES